jgi:hypothetical protein
MNLISPWLFPPESLWVNNLRRAREVVEVCRSYAAENGGRFPESLAEIAPGLPKYNHGRYVDMVSKRKYDWLY